MPTIVVAGLLLLVGALPLTYALIRLGLLQGPEQTAERGRKRLRVIRGGRLH